jgi:hypothetical protein
MAIDFGRMIQGVATGAIGQYNAEVAAKDKMKGEMIKRIGINFLENTLPEFEKKEKSRKETYDKLSNIYGSDVAEFYGEQGLITGDGNDFNNITGQMKGRGIDKDYISSYVKQQGSSYAKRAESRFDAIKEREKTIMGLTTGDSKIGAITAQLQIPKAAPISTDTQTQETETITSEGTVVPGTPIKTMDTTEEFPLQTSRITGDFDMAFPLTREKLQLEFKDIQKLNNDADKAFNDIIIKKYGSTETIPDKTSYLEGYDIKKHGPDKKEYAVNKYRQAYIADIIKQYEKQVAGSTIPVNYGIAEGTKVSDIVIQSREKITEIENNSTIPPEQKEIYIERIKSDVKGTLSSMDIDPSKFGF